MDFFWISLGMCLIFIGAGVSTLLFAYALEVLSGEK